MSNNELTATIREFREYRQMRDQLDAELKRLQSIITEHMETHGTDEMTVDVYKVSYKPVTSARLDTKALKTANPDLVAQFTITSITHRFIVA